MVVNVSKKARCQILDNLVGGEVFYFENDEEGEEVYMMLTTAAAEGEDLKAVEIENGNILAINKLASVVKVECRAYVVKPL